MHQLLKKSWLHGDTCGNFWVMICFYEFTHLSWVKHFHPLSLYSLRFLINMPKNLWYSKHNLTEKYCDDWQCLIFTVTIWHCRDRASSCNIYAVQQDTQCGNGWTCRVVRTVEPHTKVCEYSLYKTLLMMDRWGPKHVELTKSAE